MPPRRDGATTDSGSFAAAGRKGGVRCVRDFELGDSAPEAFEIVEAASLFGKNVHDEAAEIEQSPIGGALAFAMFGFALQFFVKKTFHFGADGLHLRRAEAGADDEIFGERAEAGEIQDGNGGSFFVLRGLDSEAHGAWEGFEFHLWSFTYF